MCLDLFPKFFLPLFTRITFEHGVIYQRVTKTAIQINLSKIDIYIIMSC
jgi:hypothetical protein